MSAPENSAASPRHGLRSTTTKAILDPQRGRVPSHGRGEAPTTVEAPFGGRDEGRPQRRRRSRGAVRPEQILDGETIISPEKDGVGVDVYVSTSSAGGGLQMNGGRRREQMTASRRSARAGAGAIVMDVLPERRPALARAHRADPPPRPDMILLSGGTDGGRWRKVVEIAELISAARPRPASAPVPLPIIYASNKNAQQNIRDLLEKRCALTDRREHPPVLERENLNPARDRHHELFMEHVMAHAPGYRS